MRAGKGFDALLSRGGGADAEVLQPVLRRWEIGDGMGMMGWDDRGCFILPPLAPPAGGG